MNPFRTAALAVPCFLVALLCIVSTTAEEEPVAQEPLSRGLKVRPSLALAEISDSNSRADAEQKTAAQEGVHEQKLADAEQRYEASVLAMAKHRDPLPAGWFGSFSEGESTFTTMGIDASRANPMYATKYGKDPTMEGATDDSARSADFFHESKSGGYIGAWQTHFPEVKGDFAGDRNGHENVWRNTPSGWREDYSHTNLDMNGGPIPAAWFDNEVRQIDGFGRPMQPSARDGLRYNEDVMWMWKERAVNSTLSCSEPGCTGRTNLAVYKGYAGEEATNCRLAFDIHPTDYDDDYSREHVEFIKVNDYIVTRGCNPRARGCNKTAELPLYSCLNGLEIDKLMDENGVLTVEAKNSNMVDECPYEGDGNKSLLAAVVVVNCMVRNKSWHETTPEPTPPPIPTQVCKGIVKCSTPGCTAENRIPCSPALALNGGTCKMNVSVRQTDYDDHLGVPEQVDFFQVEDTNVTDGAVEPGKNPCNAKYKDNPLKEEDLWMNAVENKDVTDLMKLSSPLGFVKVTGKISDQVDECGYKGNLLYSEVTIHCDPPQDKNGTLQFSAMPPGGLDELPRMLLPPSASQIDKDHGGDAMSGFLSRLSLTQQNSTVGTDQNKTLDDPDEFLQESMTMTRGMKLAQSIRRHLSKQSA